MVYAIQKVISKILARYISQEVRQHFCGFEINHIREGAACYAMSKHGR